MQKKVSKFASNESGNFAMTFGVTIFPVLFLTGLAVDYSMIQKERWRLQETADASALYTVRELQKAGTTESQLQKIGDDVVEANFMIEGEVDFALDAQNNTLRVELSKEYLPSFLAVMDPGPITIGVVAEVRYEISDPRPKCFISLSKTGKGVLNLNGNSVIDAEECGVHVNSSDSSAVDLNGSGTEIHAASNCFVGGVDSGLSRIFPPPENNCPVLEDPFDEIVKPSVGACNHSNFKLTGGGVLSPGVYCNGLSLSGNGNSGASVQLNPGLYIIDDGAFSTSGTVSLTVKAPTNLSDPDAETGVTFYFTGSNSQLNFSGGTTFNLKAMKTGSLKGFVLYMDPNAVTTKTNAFSGNANTYFEGILYFGENDLTVNGNGSVNTGSPFSVILADTITLNGNATINFKVDDQATDIPVPPELYDKTITAYLIK